MALANGTRLGPYEVQSALGAGGMGEVYRARDTRLDRTVAVKVLPGHMSSDPGLRQRFDREARVISALQHPHICTLHDVGHQNGVDYLVMEYLEGQSLAERLSRGPLPLEQALKIGIQIADALDRAHQRGIVHRDLKPGNIMLAESGAKLMDFGLARQVQEAPVAAVLTEITAENRKLTAEGSLIGTFQYMAPEQLEGHEADARSDIFAFGAVLYEMVTGKPAFQGRTKASLIAAILSSEPAAITTIQPMSPPALDRVLRTCLAKGPADRFQSAHDLKLQLEWIAEAGSQAGVAAPVVVRRRRRQRLAIAVIALLTIVSVALAWWAYSEQQQVANTLQIRAMITEPDKVHFYFVGDTGGPPVLSPDGQNLAFVASDGQGNNQLWVRSMTGGDARALSGTNDATFPFWSADGKSIGFFAEGKLKRIDLSGALMVLADASNGRGGAWSADGTIVFSPEFRTGLFKVPALGGKPQPIYEIHGTEFTSYRWPQVLPDGKHIIFLAVQHQAGSDQEGTIFWGSVDGSTPKAIGHGSTAAHYASGYLLTTRNSTLLAQRFAPASGKLSGDTQVLADHVLRDSGVWRDIYDVSQNGILVYQPGDAVVSNFLQLVERDGRVVRNIEVPSGYQTMQLSPSGKHIAVQGNPALDIWNYDLERGTRSRVTFDAAQHLNPIWTSDGRWITYGASGPPNSPYTIKRKAADGTGSEEQLVGSNQPLTPAAWSPDDRVLTYIKGVPGQSNDEIWIHTVADGKETLLLKSQFGVNSAAISHDGKWLAYDTTETGRPELFVSPFPNINAGRWQVSTQGGYFPIWSRSGKEIFYVTQGNTEISSADYTTQGGQFAVGRSQVFLRINASTVAPIFGVTPDGKRFLIPHNPQGTAAPLELIINWTAQLKK